MISSANSESRGGWILGGIALWLTACASGPIDQAPGTSAPPYAAVAAGQDSRTERTKAIAAYRDYLERYPDSEEYSEVSRRLADLLLEQGLNAELEATVSQGGATRAAPDAGHAYREAAERYEELLLDSPNDQ